MNRLLKIILFLSTILFNSCSEFGTNIIVKNNTDKIIESVIVSNGFSEIILKDLKKSEERKDFIDFRVNSPKNDGAYFIQVFDKNGIKNKKIFGYFSNGIPSGGTYYIKIQTDSVIISEHFNN